MQFCFRTQVNAAKGGPQKNNFVLLLVQLILIIVTTAFAYRQKYNLEKAQRNKFAHDMQQKHTMMCVFSVLRIMLPEHMLCRQIQVLHNAIQPGAREDAPRQVRAGTSASTQIVA